MQLLRSCRVNSTLNPSLPSCQIPVSQLPCTSRAASPPFACCPAVQWPRLIGTVLSLLPLSSDARPLSGLPGCGPSPGPLHPDRPIRTAKPGRSRPPPGPLHLDSTRPLSCPLRLTRITLAFPAHSTRALSRGPTDYPASHPRRLTPVFQPPRRPAARPRQRRHPRAAPLPRQAAPPRQRRRHPPAIRHPATLPAMTPKDDDDAFVYTNFQDAKPGT